MELKEISIEKIKPNPYQARVEFPEEKLKEMASTIRRKEIGLLQPISVRRARKGDGYELIMGEMRLRASKLAGLKKIPAMIKDVDDKGVALQSLIENVQRTDLKPIPKARGLFEVYRKFGNIGTLEVPKIKSALDTLSKIELRELKRGMTDFEKKVKEIADTVGLSYRHQARLISQLKLDKDEQDRVDKLEIDSAKIERIVTIEDKNARSRMIEIAPDLSKEEFSKTITVVNKAPEHLKKEVFDVDSEITPEIATTILDIKNEKDQKAIVTKIKKEKMSAEQTEALINIIKKTPEHLKKEMVEPESKITPSIATKILTIKNENDQKAIVTKVKKEEMSADRTEKLVSTIKKSTETVKKAMLKPKSRITSEIADTILTLQDERVQKEVIKEVEEHRLDEDEAKIVVEQIVSYRDKISPSEGEWTKIKEQYDEIQEDIKTNLENPEVKRRGKIFRNWLAHGNLDAAVRSAMCPICGAGPENLVWKCHNLTIADALEKSGEAYQNSMVKREINKEDEERGS